MHVNTCGGVDVCLSCCRSCVCLCMFDWRMIHDGSSTLGARGQTVALRGQLQDVSLYRSSQQQQQQQQCIVGRARACVQ